MTTQIPFAENVMQPTLFIIKTDPTGETNRKNFAEHWNFQRLLAQDRDSLVTLISNIQTARSGHAVNLQDRQRVEFRIQQCLLLSQEDFRVAMANTSRSREILRQLCTAESERFDELIRSAEAV
jgi:hypothetical protein